MDTHFEAELFQLHFHNVHCLGQDETRQNDERCHMFSGGGVTQPRRRVSECDSHHKQLCALPSSPDRSLAAQHTLPLGDTHLVEVEDQLSARVMKIFPKRFGCFEERTGNLESQVCPGNTFYLKKFVIMMD
jgi:hypothetical protein